MPVTAAQRGRIAPAVEAGAWLALAAGMWIYSYQFDGEFPAYLWGPVSWPRAVLAAIVVLALAQLALRTMPVPRSAPSADETGGDGTRGAGTGGEAEARAYGRESRGPEPERGEARDESGEIEDAQGEARSGTDARLRILATFTLPLLYLLLLPRTGYFLTTPLFLVAYMVAFREHSLKYMLGTTALLYVGSLAIFSKLLFVPLPTGNWPGFYDFSNWLLEILHAL